MAPKCQKLGSGRRGVGAPSFRLMGSRIKLRTPNPPRANKESIGTDNLEEDSEGQVQLRMALVEAAGAAIRTKGKCAGG